MKILVTGVNGQLGHDVMLELNKRGHECIGTDITPEYAGTSAHPLLKELPYRPLDITEKEAVEETIKSLMPDAVIHCAAWTAVDAAEDEENKEKVHQINVEGTKHIASSCKKIRCKMMYLSTDYVFDGQGEMPRTADCHDYAPLNVYGQTKLEGEQAVAELLDNYFIVRIAWVFGVNGNNFVKTMLRIGKKFEKLTVVCDQIGTPTYTEDLARLLVDMIETEKYGYYHATNEGGYISWHAFATEIFKIASELGFEDYDADHLIVAPVTTQEYGISKAARPFNSRLDKSKLIEAGFTPLPDWQDALRRYIHQIDLNEV